MSTSMVADIDHHPYSNVFYCYRPYSSLNLMLIYAWIMQVPLTSVYLLQLKHKASDKFWFVCSRNVPIKSKIDLDVVILYHEMMHVLYF